MPGDDAQGHSVPARASPPQRLLPIPPTPRRDRGRRADRGLGLGWPPCRGSSESRPALGHRVLLGVDVGGTFTDAALVEGGRLHTAKAPTTPGDEARGVLDAIDAVLGAAGIAAGEVDVFAHGMTVATNALLEGRGARTALVATRGFTDVVELGRQARPSLYRLEEAGPAALAPPDRRFAADERAGPDGPLLALTEAAAQDVAERVAGAAPDAVAVVLLHAYAHPQAERAVGEALRARLPGTHVSLSHEVVGTFREYERAATTEADAALSPLVSDYLSALSARAAERGLPPVAVMQSSGGLTDAGRAGAHAALTVLSGPAGGAAGAALLAADAGIGDVLCFDMGGTSCDVCAITGGVVAEVASRSIGGRPIALPSLDIHTVGAGGGSIAWRDPGGALRVGPQSAGSVPGPACYGHGGDRATVTDANLLLGRLPSKLGELRLDTGCAERAVAALARELAIATEACAEGIVRVANVEMARALRLVTVQRGLDPRRFALMPFGGAGPLHAAALADELGIETILCPLASGVLSALGLAAGAPRHDSARTVMLDEHELTRDLLEDVIGELAARAAQGLGEEPVRRAVRLELRYRGQGHELMIEAPDPPAPATVRERFELDHTALYGYNDPGTPIQLVTVRASAWGPAPALESFAPAGGADAAPQADAHIASPAVIALAESTIYVPPGWAARRSHPGLVTLSATP